MTQKDMQRWATDDSGITDFRKLVALNLFA